MHPSHAAARVPTRTRRAAAALPLAGVLLVPIGIGVAATAAGVPAMAGMDAAGAMPAVASASSAMWTRAPGGSWPGAAVAFVAAWVAMSAAMMLPVVAPALWRYGRAVAAAGGARGALLTAVAAAGYLGAWTVVGAVVFPLGAAVSAVTAAARPPASIVAAAAGAVVALAGVWQLTSWKARHLARCRAPARRPRPTVAAAWGDGVRLGAHCLRACANLTAVLLVVGIMDLRVMAVVGVAIAAERLAPAGARTARATGVALLVAGVLLGRQVGRSGISTTDPPGTRVAHRRPPPPATAPEAGPAPSADARRRVGRPAAGA